MIILIGQNGIIDDITAPAVSYSFHTIRYRVTRNDPVVKLDVNSVMTMAYHVSCYADTVVIAIIRVDTRRRIFVKPGNYIV